MLVRAIKYQLKYRIIKNYKIWFVLPVVLIVFVISFVQACNNYCYVTGKTISPCAGDCLLWILKGMKSARLSDTFYIPDGMWMAYYGIMFYVIGISTMDMGRFENRIMTSMGDKSVWWNSKCFSCVIMIIMNQIMVIVMTYIVGFLYGDVRIVPQDDVMRAVAGMTVPEDIGIKKVMYMYLAVVVTCVAYALLQMVISIVAGQITAIVVTIILLVFSVYVENPFFMGNNLMLMRYGEYTGRAGIGVSYRILIAIVAAVMCVVAGNVIVKGKSFVLEKNR